MAIQLLGQAAAVLQLFAQVFTQVFGLVGPPGVDHLLQGHAHHLGVGRWGGGGGWCAHARGGTPLREVAHGLRVQHNAPVGLGQQSRPTRIVLGQLVHLARGLVGQQMHCHTVQLCIVYRHQQTLIVAGHQHMVASLAAGQFVQVGAQSAQHGCAAVGGVRQHHAHHLVGRVLAIGLVGVPINPGHIGGHAGLVQQGRQHRGQGLAAQGFGDHFLVLAQKPSHVAPVHQGHASALALCAVKTVM